MAKFQLSQESCTDSIFKPKLTYLYFKNISAGQLSFCSKILLKFFLNGLIWQLVILGHILFVDES